MNYRNNQDFVDSQKVGVPELTVFLDDKIHCIINDNEQAAQLIKTITDCYPDKIVRIERGGK